MLRYDQGIQCPIGSYGEATLFLAPNNKILFSVRAFRTDGGSATVGSVTVNSDGALDEDRYNHEDWDWEDVSVSPEVFWQLAGQSIQEAVAQHGVQSLEKLFRAQVAGDSLTRAAQELREAEARTAELRGCHQSAAEEAAKKFRELPPEHIDLLAAHEAFPGPRAEL